jgi:hypothetical protein
MAKHKTTNGNSNALKVVLCFKFSKKKLKLSRRRF